VCHRRRHSPLRLAGAHALEEEIGIAAEIIGRGQSNRVDAVLDCDQA